MTKLNLFKCDRCGKEVKLPEGHKLANVTQTQEETVGEPSVFSTDICEDCLSSYEVWLIESGKVDKYINTLDIEGGEKKK